MHLVPIRERLAGLGLPAVDDQQDRVLL